MPPGGSRELLPILPEDMDVDVASLGIGKTSTWGSAVYSTGDKDMTMGSREWNDVYDTGDKKSSSTWDDGVYDTDRVAEAKRGKGNNNNNNNSEGHYSKTSTVDSMDSRQWDPTVYEGKWDAGVYETELRGGPAVGAPVYATYSEPTLRTGKPTAAPRQNKSGQQQQQPQYSTIDNGSSGEYTTVIKKVPGRTTAPQGSDAGHHYEYDMASSTRPQSTYTVFDEPPSQGFESIYEDRQMLDGDDDGSGGFGNRPVRHTVYEVEFDAVGQDPDI